MVVTNYPSPVLSRRDQDWEKRRKGRGRGFEQGQRLKIGKRRMNGEAVEPLGFAHREEEVCQINKNAGSELHKTPTAGAIGGRVQL